MIQGVRICESCTCFWEELICRIHDAGLHVAHTLLCAYFQYWGECQGKRKVQSCSVMKHLAECPELFVSIHGTILHTVVAAANGKVVGCVVVPC
jgi:hypothetical protein